MSPAAFFQFDLELSDEKALRRKIEGLLQKAGPSHLQRIHKIIEVLLEV